MAIPPIIANNPLLKLFRTEQGSAAKGKTDLPPVPATPADIVEVSKAAKQRLDGIENLSADNSARVQEVAGDTRDILQETGLSLGLDRNFA